MTRVLVLVEGQTEETFVRDILEPILEEHDVFLTPTLATTKRVKAGPDFKGGIVSYGKFKNDLVRLLGDSNAATVTTMIDYYGLPTDFPGMGSRPPGPGATRAAHVESVMKDEISDPRFRPYLQLHEFEALLFADPAAVAQRFPASGGSLARLVNVRQAVSTPEEINEQPETCPSSQISRVLPAYQKPLHGPQIAGAMD